MTPVITVAIPVYNGARYLDEVLSAVRAQRVDAEVELLIMDSGSTDGSLELAERYGATIHRLPKGEFSHGGTRNRMVELARGEYVVFITQDATPAHDGWLAAVLEGFQQADDVALVFGPHDARPDASHMIKCEMERHFATFGDGITLQRLGRSAREIADYRAFPGRLSFFSDVNGAVAKWAWRQIPYRTVPYAEDQLLGREMIEAGFAKAYHPEMRVLHSHDYPPAQFFRRYFDEFRSLREVLDHVEVAHPVRTPMTVRGLVGHDKRWLQRQGVSGRALVKPLAVSARHHALRQAGAIVGTRADRVPRPLRKALSLEGRDSFTPFDVPESPLLATTTQPDAKPVELTSNWDWAFAKDFYPLRQAERVPHSGDATGPWTVAWVLPPWRVGSGGHTTIFRLIRQLELRGHRNAIFVLDTHGHVRDRGSVLRTEIRERFVPGVEAEVFVGLDDFDSADVAVATGWQTAGAVRDLPNCREKAYLVQDHEPEFYATSAQAIWAEDSYRMGLRCIAFSTWMADVLRDRYGLDARWFECGTDLDVFQFAGPEGRDNEIIPVYARRETERRAVDLAMAGLAVLAERRPTIRPVLFGSRQKSKLPFPAEDLGVVAPQRLAELYRQSAAGIVFSLTTHSLVAQEMMASGLPLVELEGENVGSALGASGERAMLAARRPDAIADALEHLLDHREQAAAMARRARAFVEEHTWDRAGDQIESALREFLSTPLH
ncbi:glycosyltransferase [Solirubrobacter sp. CPCC 204708]|uniref:Glycosyltransferase n=1 Tax=Solirubrobacter deserti TaxID=2282478 RepID=A0ABT4RN62_9ACTN|nr:glycosyltransferase [Solirubrobacter deserti]MBE2317416.1 glycosyltransferase [Solirubrobacter deserti]MDA0139998.1 glycosyltransferase [Solirubrobacter deserti]